MNIKYLNLSWFNKTIIETSTKLSTTTASTQKAYEKCLLTNSTNTTNTERINFTLGCFWQKLCNDYYFLFLTCLFIFIITIDILLNLIILSSILLEKFKTRVDLCFMSNAFADLLMGVIIMPLTALYTLFGHFPFGPYVCFLWNCLDFTAGTTSMLHLSLISFDRYLSVSKPLKYTNKHRAENRFSVHGLPTSLILILIWFFSCTAWIPVLLYFKSTELRSSESSQCDINGSPIIILPHSLVVYYLPMFLIIYFYTKTIKIVNDKMRRRRHSTTHNHTLNSRNTKLCCLSNPIVRKEDIKLKNQNVFEIENVNVSKSETLTNISKIENKCAIIRSSSLENNLSKSLENSRHLDELYRLKKSLNRTYNSSLNIHYNCGIKEEYKGILKAPNSGSHTLNKTLSFKLNTNVKHTKFVKPKLKLSITSTLSSNILARKEKNVTYKLGMIMVTFIFSWFPFCVLWSFTSLCFKWSVLCFVPANLYIFSFWLAYLNSIFTPLILLYNNNKYRKSIHLLQRFFAFRNSNNSLNRVRYTDRKACVKSQSKTNLFNNSYAENNSLLIVRRSSLNT